MTTTARAVCPVVATYPDHWEPTDYPTRNIYIVTSDADRLAQQQAGDPERTTSLGEASVRMAPVTVADGRLPTDVVAPLEPLARHTVRHLRHQ